MPFTQIYNYFGLVVLAFGVLALCGRKHRRLAVFLWIASLIFLIMSFGSATPWLSGLFMKYLPYFNKFRVPSMILTMVQVIAALLAALGLDTLLSEMNNREQKWSKGLFRAFWICGGIFVVWLLLGKTIFGGMSFTTAGEMAQRFGPIIVVSNSASSGCRRMTRSLVSAASEGSELRVSQEGRQFMHADLAAGSDDG